MNVSIFGLGYVGCVSIGCLADQGHKVIGVDVAESKINLINRGKPTIIEKDIDTLIKKGFDNKLISATHDFIHAVKHTDISIICVGTPNSPEGHLNLEYIFRTAENIANGIREKNGFHIIVIRSTVMPGTNQKVGQIIEQVSGVKRNEGFAVISNPEFLREGTAIEDYFNPSITVLGGDHEPSIATISELYKKINAPIEITEIKVAEIIKYVNNSFHALKITFANEIGNICKRIGIDSHKVMGLFCKDNHLNISTKYFRPGNAYGGSCLPKDLKALKTIAHDSYLESPLVNSIELSNSMQKNLVLELIVKKNIKKIGLLGLSFKSGTDDLRHSPAVELAEALLGKGYLLSIYDKNVNLSNITGTNKSYIEKHIPHISDIISGDLESVIMQSDLLVVTQYNDAFKTIVVNYPEKEIIDLVRIDELSHGMKYEGISW